MATALHDIAGRIEEFIRKEFRVMNDDSAFSRDAHLYESGYVDSAGVVELIAFLESSFDIQLRDEHIFSDDFTTINGITTVVGASLSGRAGAEPVSEGSAA